MYNCIISSDIIEELLRDVVDLNASIEDLTSWLENKGMS